MALLPTTVSVTFPVAMPGYNRISVIKAVRSISGMGLREAKDISESAQHHLLTVALPGGVSNEDHYLDEQCRILENNGCKVGPTVRDILRSLRELGASALVQGEDELANEILQLVLAEKLRRKP